jgi:hypothetical protein
MGTGVTAASSGVLFLGCFAASDHTPLPGFLRGLHQQLLTFEVFLTALFCSMLLGTGSTAQHSAG